MNTLIQKIQEAQSLKDYHNLALESCREFIETGDASHFVSEIMNLFNEVNEEKAISYVYSIFVEPSYFQTFAHACEMLSHSPNESDQLYYFLKNIEVTKYETLNGDIIKFKRELAYSS